MRVFDESKTRELTEYDLSAGYLKPDKLFIAHHEATRGRRGASFITRRSRNIPTAART